MILIPSTPSLTDPEINVTKIAVADAYSCYWRPDESPRLTSNGDGGAYVIENKPHSVGWESGFNLNDLTMNLYDSFDVQINPIYECQDQGNGSSINILTGIWFKAGTLLTSVETTNVSDPDITPNSNSVLKEVRSLYAVPEKWLRNLNDTATYVIGGTINSDGSIFIEGRIAFLIDNQIIEVDTITGEETEKKSVCTLSPVYRNIRFYNSNGYHRYKVSYLMPQIDEDRINEMRTYVNRAEGDELPDSHGDEGNGGRVSRPIDPRPIKSRLQNAVPQNITLNMNRGTDPGKPILHEFNRGTMQVPIYISQVNDTTVYVYNLYGVISEVNVFYPNKFRSAKFPVQPFDQSTEHSIYAFSNNPRTFDILGTASRDSISWGMTILVNYEGLINHYYDDNCLYFNDGSSFYIPGSAPRGDVNRDGDVSITDVTALIGMLLNGESDNPSLLGRDAIDCNRDDDITITDVTTLINYLLTGRW